SEEILVIDQPVDQDVYAARREVNVQSSISGDLVAAAQRVTVDGVVDGDMILAAREIEIRSQGNDDLRLAGQHIQITSPVAGHVVAAGQTVTIRESVGDWAWLFGDTIDVQGDVGGELKVRANTITIDSEVDGDVELAGNDLQIGPNAIVHGNLTWRSENEADISPEAQIDGEFVQEPSPGLAEDVKSGRALSFTISVIVAVVLLFLLFPRPLHTCAERLAAHPGKSLALGFAVLVSIPVLALILIFSPLKAWIGLTVICIWLALLVLGVLTGLFALSHFALRRFQSNPTRWQALVAILVIVVAIGLLSYVPYLGAIAVMIIWLLGLGTLSWGGWVALRRS
ncbi:MAG: hypothetical protein ACR2QT_08150, partial [Woeseiaceae bacterium]